MRKLVLTSKTGFQIKDVNKPVIIRDERGKLFYTTEELLPRVKKFNLPAGVYFIDSGYFTSLPFPRSFKKKDVPAPERFGRPDPTTFSVRFDSNPHKCTIDWDKKEIVFDNSFVDKSLPEIDFIRFHEYGHRYYKDDAKCDLYARNCMINKGYNPSQIGYAQLGSLSDRQKNRKETLVKSLI